MAYSISPDQQSFFDEKGYLILRDLMSEEDTVALQHWAQEVHDLPRTSETPWMPYEEINSSGKRVLCRTENYANYHPQLNGLLRAPKTLSILGQLAGEDMSLFKEKIDDSNTSNGGLEVVEGSHSMDIPIDSSNCIEKSWVEKQRWVPVELEAGQLLVFGSYLAHRSGANNSSSDRKAIYATYNCKSEGDLHDAYYEDRAKMWPPTHKRQEGDKYEEGSLRYAYGSPMLSVDLGKQYAV